MTTAEHITDGFQLPTTLKLEYATIVIPDNLTDVSTIKELTTVYAETNHLLSLLSDEEKGEAQYEDGLGWSLTTDNQAAIRYACQHYFLCEPSCIIDAVFNKFGEDVCSDCIDDIVETALEQDFDIQVLSDNSVYVIFDKGNQ